MDTKISIAGPNDFLSLLATELGDYGFMTIIDAKESKERKDSFDCCPCQPVNCHPFSMPACCVPWGSPIDFDVLLLATQAILTIVSSGGLITVLSSYLKHRKKTFKIKTDKDGGFNFECENIKPDEMKEILHEMNTYLKSNLEDDKKELE